jgi:hypothetical protein
VQEAMIFEDLVHPILENKCMQCHKKDKKKGQLSLQAYESILKGGKHGPAIVPGSLDESELYRRITLDPSHDDFMPQDGKTPMTSSETEMIRWWIEKGMGVEKQKLSEIKGNEEITSAAAIVLGLGTESPGEVVLTGGEVNDHIPDTVDMTHVDALRAKGLIVRTMLRHPLMLDVTLPPQSGKQMSEIAAAITPLASNIIMLNLSDNNLNENDLALLRAMPNLKKLRLEKNPISDSISNHLIGLKFLEAVNLNETNIGATCVSKLRENPSIKRIYAWKTNCRTCN